MTHDSINNPSHYSEGRKYEPIEVIEDWGLGFGLGNAVKYISRAGRKGDFLQDLKKARFYIDREIQLHNSPYGVAYEEIVEGLIENAVRGYDDYGHSDYDSIWDPSLGPVELSEEEVDEILRNRDITDTPPDEIVKVIEKRGFLLGVKANGDTCVVKENGGGCE